MSAAPRRQLSTLLAGLFPARLAETMAVLCGLDPQKPAGMLTREERAAFTRGRNAKPHSMPKHCSIREYAYATGLEVLFGTLYLKGETGRVQQLWEQVLEVLA